MTIIRFLGDCHGKYRRYSTIISNSPYPTIQVGDMGVGFRSWPHGKASANPPYDKMVAGKHRFIRGNHDNPAVCARHSQYISDGTVETAMSCTGSDMMFVGGAVSIDKAYRIEGYSWWADEELSGKELQSIKFLYGRVAPAIMVTHECPESIAAMIVGRIRDLRNGGYMKMEPRFASRTRMAFESMFRAYQPKLWIFGHWHVAFDQIVNGTRFICLPELETIDVDIDKAEVIEREKAGIGFIDDGSPRAPLDNNF
jgi:hypothetical protein